MAIMPALIHATPTLALPRFRCSYLLVCRLNLIETFTHAISGGGIMAIDNGFGLSAAAFAALLGAGNAAVAESADTATALPGLIAGFISAGMPDPNGKVPAIDAVPGGRDAEHFDRQPAHYPAARP
jgi:hypothetical protein